MTRCRRWQGRKLCVDFQVNQRATHYRVSLDFRAIGEVQTLASARDRPAFQPLPFDRGYMLEERTLQKATSALAERFVKNVERFERIMAEGR